MRILEYTNIDYLLLFVQYALLPFDVSSRLRKANVDDTPHYSIDVLPLESTTEAVPFAASDLSPVATRLSFDCPPRL